MKFSKIARSLGKIRVGWELLLWSVVYGYSDRQFGMKLDYLAGRGIKTPYWFLPHQFLIFHGRIAGAILVVSALFVSFHELKGRIAPNLLWIVRVIPLIAYAYLVFTNYPVFINLIQQIQ